MIFAGDIQLSFNNSSKYKRNLVSVWVTIFCYGCTYAYNTSFFFGKIRQVIITYNTIKWVLKGAVPQLYTHKNQFGTFNFFLV